MGGGAGCTVRLAPRGGGGGGGGAGLAGCGGVMGGWLVVAVERWMLGGEADCGDQEKKCEAVCLVWLMG